MKDSFVLDAQTMALEPWPLNPQDIIAGAPQISGRVVWRSEDGRCQRGVWQITPGAVRDIEVDEMFVVLSGRATLILENRPPLDLFPGVVGVLRAGERTVWRISETLRKVYQLRT